MEFGQNANTQAMTQSGKYHSNEFVPTLQYGTKRHRRVFLVMLVGLKLKLQN